MQDFLGMDWREYQAIYDNIFTSELNSSKIFAIPTILWLR